jgi:hypothetical protein
MSKPTKPREYRLQAVYRVEITEYVNGRKVISWSEKGPPDRHGFLTRQIASAPTPMGLWTRKEAELIVAGWRKPRGARLKASARVVKDEKAAGELRLQLPTGEAA